MKNISCIYCGNPIHRWDNGVWYHILMGQTECSMKSKEFKATPPARGFDLLFDDV